MTPFNVIEWAIAELKATPTVQTALGSDYDSLVLAWGEEMPSKPGVYIGVLEAARIEPFAQESELRIRIVQTGSSAYDGQNKCGTLLELIRTVLSDEPGTPKTRLVNPATKGLRMNLMRWRSFTTPERDGPASHTYAATLILTFKGSTRV